MARYSSPPPRTSTPVTTVMATHSIRLNGSVRNILPPKVTISHCPTKISPSTSARPRSLQKWRKALWTLPRHLALRRFQNCSITNVVKNSVSSCTSMTLPAPCRSHQMRKANMMMKKMVPMNKIPLAIGLVMINCDAFRGLSRITSWEGGSEARARAAKVSIMRLTHRICVTVSGISVPITEPPSTSSKADRLTTSWKKRNRWMFL